MVSPRLNRFVLLALLPVIAFIVYVEGQKYDPALIRFTSSDIGTGDDTALFPREIEGFSRYGQVRIFTKENLYEYVNGHAEYFLSAGFERLAVGEYVQMGSEPVQPDVVVDIYDMGKSVQAFGVLTDEVGGDPATLRAGMIGAKTPQGVSFVRGKYFVRISAYRDTIPIDGFTEHIDRMIGPSSEVMPAFSRLPDMGDVVATRFVKEAYRGLGFANNVMEREYRIQDKTVQVSLITGTEAEVKGLVELYLDFFRESDIVHDKLKKNGKELFRVNDPYEGDWYLVPFSDALFGIYGVDDGDILDQILLSLTKTGTSQRVTDNQDNQYPNAIKTR